MTRYGQDGPCTLLEAQDDDADRHRVREAIVQPGAEVSIGRLKLRLLDRAVQIERLTAELADLREKVARVEALADDHRQPGALIRSGEGDDAPLVWMTHIRAALNGYRIEWSSGMTGYHLVALAAPAPVEQHDDATDAPDLLGALGEAVDRARQARRDREGA